MIIKILLFLIIILTTSYPSLAKDYNKTDDETQHKYTKKRLEITAGIEVGKAGLNATTAADSILEWRNSTYYAPNIDLKLNLTDNSYLMLESKYSMHHGGEMSDDDIQNFYGVYSRTRKMKGRGFDFKLTSGMTILENESNAFDLFGGFQSKRVSFDPQGLWQVSVPDGFTLYSPTRVQSLDATFMGLRFGGKYIKKLSNAHELSLQAAIFLPLITVSKQDDWGYGAPDYDWKMQKSGLRSARGFDLRLQDSIKISPNVWWNIYMFFETIRSSNLRETDYDSTGTAIPNGYTKQLKWQQTGVGTSFTFK